MPSLTYFPIQGRGQACRYALQYHEVEFENATITFDEWRAAKEAGTYAPATGLPVWTEDDGTRYNQEMAILMKITQENGSVPQSPKETYEMFWYWEMLKDHKTEGTMGAFFKENCEEEVIEKVVNSKIAIIDKCDDRWADGRAHVAGANITAADFSLLGSVTSCWDNANLRNPSLRERIQAHLATKTNVTRVIQGIREACEGKVTWPETHV